MSTKSKLHMKREGTVKRICNGRKVAEINTAISYTFPYIFYYNKKINSVSKVRQLLGSLTKPMLKQIEAHINMK